MLFFLLFSGPPRFRIRDPEATLEGRFDLAVLIAAAVWLIAGLWIAYQLWATWRGQRPRLTLRFPQHLAIPVILCLGASTIVSVDPSLTAFKVYQMIVILLFSWMFLEWYGTEQLLDHILAGCAILCALVVGALFVAPGLVLFKSETGFPRLRGEGITIAATVACIGIVTLFARRREMSEGRFLILAMLFGGVLFFSLTRIAWLAVAIFFLLALWKRPRIRTLGWIRLIWILAAIALLLGATTLIEHSRDISNVSSVGGRLGLWAFYVAATLSRSPWLGLGFFAGTRDVGSQYDPTQGGALGSGHSIFFDVFVGGGFISLFFFAILIAVLLTCAVVLLWRRRDALSFGVASLAIAVVLLGSVGSAIDSTPFGFTFWSLITMLARLRSPLRFSLVRARPSPERPGAGWAHFRPGEQTS